MSVRLLGDLDHAAMLRQLAHRSPNFVPAEVRPPAWNFDTYRHHLADEAPGRPEPNGAWEIARGLVRDYEFSVPGRVRAVFDRRTPLLGRTMLLQGRFSGLRFYMGTRVTEVVDETDDQKAVWGWAYDTLEGHLERGRMRYRVVKDLGTGAVEFVISGYSQRAPTLGSVLRLGWWMFGRPTQLRFYRRCGARLHTLVHRTLAGDVSASRRLTDGDLVLVPSGTRPRAADRLAVRRTHPGGRDR